jgi:uncharacterized RDD family membrane protein YckC
MSFRCKSCGAELVKRFASGGAKSRNAGGAAAAAVAMESPMDMPAMAPAASGRSYAGDTPLAGRGSRLMAALLDALFLGLSIVPGVLILSTMGGSDGMNAIGLLGFIIGPAIFLVYTIRILVRDGQTLGKKVMKIRIVNYDDGGNPGFGRVIVMRGFVNGLLSNIPFYALVDVLFIFGSEQRCLHDLIAKTKVVQAAG